LNRPDIKTLFLDIGQVLLSNGWDRYSRQKAIDQFNLDKNEITDRHHIFFETYEMGKMSLAEYLQYVVFYEPRNFSVEEFTTFIYSQSTAYTDSIAYFMAIKKKYGLNIVSINNEGRELNEFRIKTFKLDELFNAFVSSCYVHLRKPDKEIFRMACAIAYTQPENALFIDDRSIHVQIAQSVGIHAIQFTDLCAVKKQMENYGFTV
jgi:putative hydrolase of the HAD superfamily